MQPGDRCAQGDMTDLGQSCRHVTVLQYKVMLLLLPVNLHACCDIQPGSLFALCRGKQRHSRLAMRQTSRQFESGNARVTIAINLPQDANGFLKTGIKEYSHDGFTPILTDLRSHIATALSQAVGIAEVTFSSCAEVQSCTSRISRN
jgi:hypothetical protein